MNCLCCGKELKTPTPIGWHQSCVKKFFGTKSFPELSVNEAAFDRLATESTGKGITVPGVQKKLSLQLSGETEKPRLTLIDHPTGYILKPQVAEYPCLPEAEHLIMTMAGSVGIATVPHALLPSGNGFSYITKRIDRVRVGGRLEKRAMEDFCQLDLRSTADKYHSSYERCAKIIERYSSRSKLDLTELFLRVLFSFAVGNSDMHLKNFSLIETSVSSNEYVLSEAYDLLPVNVLLPEDTEETAMPLNGKKRNLRKKDFLVFADTAGIPRETAQKMIGRLLSQKKTLLKMTEDSFLSEELKDALLHLIESRCAVFEA